MPHSNESVLTQKEPVKYTNRKTTDTKLQNETYLKINRKIYLNPAPETVWVCVSHVPHCGFVRAPNITKRSVRATRIYVTVPASSASETDNALYDR